MEAISVPIEHVYIPVKRRKTLDSNAVIELAERILEEGLKTPILVRPDKNRFVLVEGLHRLEASKAHGEVTINAYEVNARLR